jgi:transposase
MIDLILPSEEQAGLRVVQIKHVDLACRCGCGHWTAARPAHQGSDGAWTVALSERHLAAPLLVALICALALRLRLSRRRIQEFLADWLGLSLGVASINQCVHEAGRALAPVEEQLLAEVRTSELLHADETSWIEHGHLRWLWVFTNATTTLFRIGRRSQERLQGVLGTRFAGWLMSDGSWAYRDHDQRLRCLAHRLRKARGIEESLDRSASGFGRALREHLEALMESVYAAREGPPPRALRQQHAVALDALFTQCLAHAESRHAKTRALARELLNDWDTFWVVLDHPDLPLTNNRAERALRHWVIARRIGDGTRNAQGSRVFATLASVIETCRQRGHLPWPFIADVMGKRRQGRPAPILPPAAA